MCRACIFPCVQFCFEANLASFNATCDLKQKGTCLCVCVQVRAVSNCTLAESVFVAQNNDDDENQLWPSVCIKAL